MDTSAGQIEIVKSDDCDLLLMVSNQSYLDDPVSLTVKIDGIEIVSDSFEVRNQHHFLRYPLLLGPGPHRLEVSSSTAVAREESFTLPADGATQYAVISYYNYADEDGALINWHIQSIPIGIR